MDQQILTVNCKITYTLFSRQGVQILTDSSETKTEFTDITLICPEKFRSNTL